MAKNDTRTYAGHWDYAGPEHAGPPPRWPWMRDAIIAAFLGLFLGGSIGFRIVHGYWPYATTIGVGGFVIHSLILGIGQIPKSLRYRRQELFKITAAGATTTAIVGVITLINAG